MAVIGNMNHQDVTVWFLILIDKNRETLMLFWHILIIFIQRLVYLKSIDFNAR